MNLRLKRLFRMVALAIPVSLLLAPTSWAQDNEKDSSDAGNEVASVESDEKIKLETKYFEAPIRLKVGDSPLNTIADLIFPSPNMYDVDGDGSSELVTGGLDGALYVYENKNENESEEPVWAEPQRLKTISGEPISVPNG